MAELDPPVSLPPDPQEAVLREAEPPREPQARPVVPLGRVLAVACLVPILAMIVLGASRFSEVRDLAVGAAPGAASAAQDDQELPSLWAPAEEHAYASSNAEAAAGEIDPGLPLLRVVETRMMTVTAYCPCQKCCGKNARGITASGKPVSYNAGRFVAADTSILRFGTLVRVPGYHGELPVEVIDRGGAIKGDKLDVYFPTHAEARQWGRRILPVQVVEPVELGAADRESISDQ